MMQCPNCRQKIKEGKAQCKYCGMVFMSSPQPKPQMHAQNAQPYPQSYPPQQPVQQKKPKAKKESPGCLIAFLLLLGISAKSTFLGSGSAVMQTPEAGYAQTENIAVMTETLPQTAPAPSEADIAYLALLRENLSGQVGQDEAVTDITLQNRVLRVTVDVTHANDHATLAFPLTDIALLRASSITDKLLTLDTSLWDAVIVDFGAIGTVTKYKSEAVSNEYGYHFTITGFDG